ncbi:Sec-independent protein translocase protein TatB [Gammaproteobacteria bacterium]|nr:Sec-independent protein translocase protein TatB [Gammaproteobacteria bacterium]MDA9561626.1 Sec-independent protein translocase protein TatB [Gammaproteobacteria bacterium]MDA9804784.1 Sec-independent protein translocase protein TatB [Gammaproteobacteria bacterium]MDC0962172.1 Sec-independent protein translocase protein TatB [Gammaproteobacteria bacterium]MDC3216860.1 Sec-independent protein translocase protein TatB [Gammaproteobacteria bacterium]
MFQIGFLEIAIILVLGLIIIGPSRLPEVIKSWLKFYRKFQNHLSKFKNDLEKDIGADELKKDVFNEMRMEELEGFEKHKDD